MRLNLLVALAVAPVRSAAFMAQSATAVQGSPCRQCTRIEVQAPASFASEAAEEAYWRTWFWDQAEDAINADERFASASKRELKRIRDFIRFNRDEEPLPKKLRKNPQYEVDGGYFPGLTTQAFHDASGAPWQSVANAYPLIKAELDRLIEREQQFVDIGKPLGWRTMPIFYRGEPHPDFPADECPHTMATLSGMRLAGETVAFQRQSPNTGLPRHVDPCSWVLACHLGMDCPDEGGDIGSPYIEVAGTKYHWRDGDVMLFDPSFRCVHCARPKRACLTSHPDNASLLAHRHQTFNPTSQERVILNIDVFHPELSDLECEAIKKTIALKKELFGSTPAEVWRG